MLCFLFLTVFLMKTEVFCVDLKKTYKLQLNEHDQTQKKQLKFSDISDFAEKSSERLTHWIT